MDNFIRDALTAREYDPLREQVPSPLLDHVMIDIETMPLHPHNALILSIGMIEFSPEPIDELLIGNRMLIIPSIEEQLITGREVSASTQKWWTTQSPAACAHWAEYAGERRSLVGTLEDVRIFCRNSSRVWANGTQFDLSNLVGLNNQLFRDPTDLWHYQAPRDMRTFCRETPETRLVPTGDALDIPGVPHEPVYDCISQAWRVWGHWQKE